jgi:anti-anti-sigma regulatory factor
MPKAMIAAWLKIDGERIVQGLREALEKLDHNEGEVVLDFTSVHRVDPDALREMDALATRADEKTVKIGLRGVNIDVYKVLKLMKLAPRFSFLT